MTEQTQKAVRKVSINNGMVSVPNNYHPYLDLRTTEVAIKQIKDYFQISLAKNLNLSRVSAPVAVLCGTGINDHLNGIERPASFDIKALGQRAEIVQSLAKWKRAALADYKFEVGEGLYTDMNAIRPDEDLTNFHSIYVDQWDWEKVIEKSDRNLSFLKDTVNKIYSALKSTDDFACATYPQLPGFSLPEEIKFIQAEELEDMYPTFTAKEREHAICKEHGAVFLIGIGSDLKSGKPHDGRAADYDDWSTPTENGFKGLNGDILVWYPLLECSLELSSMGIRVDSAALKKQLEIRDEQSKKELPWHQRLLAGELPLTVGGGIGQSRLCLFFLRKAHVGEVQSGIWQQEMQDICQENNIALL